MGLWRCFFILFLFFHLGQASASSPETQLELNKNLRIVALAPHLVEMLYAIGAGEQIVATTEHADYPQAAQNIPRIGGFYGIQIEKLLSLKPDLVLVWDGGNQAKDIDKIHAFGIKTYHSNPKTLDDVANELETLGQLTNHQLQAKQVAQAYRAELKNLRQHSEKLAKVKVFYQLWSQPLMTVAKQSWINQMIELCGGQNVFVDAASAYPQISLENVIQAKPEVILQSQDKTQISSINWRQWPEIPAVKQHHIFKLNADLVHRASPRAIEGVKAVCLAINHARVTTH